MCYQMLASVYRLPYYCLVTEPMNRQARLFDADLLVNLDELNGILQMIPPLHSTKDVE
jgi:hypothetical protein